MTYTEFITIIAADIVADLKEDGFENFKEMCDLYWWDSKDIRDYVSSFVSQYRKDAWMDEDNGEITIFHDGSDEPYKYRSFIAAIRKEIKRLGF